MGKKRRRKVTRYWHGGAPGLAIGDLIVPALELPVPLTLYQDPEYDTDPSFVYVTTNQTFATSCAAQWGSHIGRPVAGDLYQVRPEGQLEADPDYKHVPGLSWTCSRATVIAVYRRSVPLTHELSVYGLRFTTWDDGRPMYDETGFLLPTASMKRAGVTAEDLRVLGPWAPWTAANHVASDVARRRQSNP